MPRHRADASPLGPGGPLSRLFLLVVVVMHVHADVLALMHEIVMHVDAVLVVAVIVVMIAADANTPRAYSDRSSYQ
jgi:cytochrome c oxidase subunit IV